MTRTTTLVAAFALLGATAAIAQTTPGGQFMESWDLDGDGTATLAELHEMRGNVFLSFDANEDGFLDAEEYVMFDEARQNDVNNYEADQRAQMQAVADGMSLPNSDADGDGRVSEHEFLAGADGWFTDLDKDGSGGITLVDFTK
ncbi:EF-hand domain-containing protein [Celeribacter sp.]|uniref:EF-hand domain-containing protein n=1 Tax=Celeribacter sp. TaxID=1890673 RepID=UPI003A923B43